jgi:hypothetical protein
MNGANKTALTTAAVIAISAMLLAAIVFIGIGTYADARLNTAIVLWTGIVEVIVVLPLWTLLRVIARIRAGERQSWAQQAGRQEPRFAETAGAADQDLPK